MSGGVVIPEGWPREVTRDQWDEWRAHVCAGARALGLDPALVVANGIRASWGDSYNGNYDRIDVEFVVLDENGLSQVDPYREHEVRKGRYQIRVVDGA